jgi:hypothetical protein
MKNAKRILTQHEIDTIQSNTCQDAAEILGVHQATISRLCKKNGITFKRLYKCVTTGGPEHNKKIRQLYKSGRSIKQISTELGVLTWKVKQVLKIRYMGEVFKYLDNETFHWLEHECPDGMSLDEFIAVIVTETRTHDDY